MSSTSVPIRLLLVLLTALACFSQPRTTIQRQLTFTPDRISGIYEVGETVGWTVSPGQVQPTYAYKFTIRLNNAVVLKAGKLDLSAGVAKIEIEASEPGMIYVAVEPYALLNSEAPAATEFTGGNTGRNNGLHAVGASVAPGRIGLSTARPDDFDEFWGSKLADQAKIPMEVELSAAVNSRDAVP